MKDFLVVNKEPLVENQLLYHVNRAGSSTVDTSFNIQRNNTYPYCVIHYVSDGCGYVICRGKKYSIKKGQLFLLNAYEPHEYATNCYYPFILNWIEFCGSESTKFLGSFLNNNPPIVEAPHSIRINKYMERIFCSLQNKSNTEKSCITVSKLVYSILLSIMDFNTKDMYKNMPQSRITGIRMAIDYIDNNLNADLKIEHLARTANFSTEYFAKLFHKMMGVTPAKYVLEKRINRAKELLSTSDVQMDYLAESIGFCNASHLIRLFKKTQGLTPSEFRKQSLLYRGRDN